MKTALLTLIFFLVYVPEQVSAMRVNPLTLEQMIEKAEIVFVGQCLTSTAQEDSYFGQTITVTEFAVSEVLKGNLGKTHQIKHYGGAFEGNSRHIVGMPTYTPGQDVILFLYGESQYGLTSPVGIWQGVFNFVGDGESSSPSMVVNGINNTGLLLGFHFDMLLNAERLSDPQRKAIQRQARVNRGPILYEDFRLITKMLIGSNE
tara:strand:- start:5122 stop:5733 length:612 start_codon:yes stop_codon:yes gene_type:complete